MTMLSKAYNIEFTGLYQGQEHHLRCFENEYRNLMALLKDKVSPEDFGQCGGMGRCGTCLIKISGLPGPIGESYRNERSTFSKMGVLDASTRLSCQIQLNDELKNATIEILENVY